MIDLQSPEVRRDPYPTYTELREKYPICQVDPGKLWALSRFEDVQHALKSYKIFTTINKTELLAPPWLKKECHRDLYLVAKDPPEHTPYRASILRPFLSSAIAKMEPLMRETAHSLIDHMMLQDDVEFLEAFAYPFVGKVIGDITGLGDSQSTDDTRAWIQAVQLLSHKKPEDKVLERIETAMIKQSSYFDMIIQDRRENPGNDIVSQLVHTQVDGQKLSDSMLNNALDLLLRAGFLTTVHQLGNGMVQLARRPELHQKLVQSPKLIPAFVDEMLRLYSSGAASVRHTTCDVTFYGTTIPENSPVILLQAAANRDPRRFPKPDDFDLSRKLNQHVAFGCGPHACIGMALARLEMEVAFECLIPRIGLVSCPPEKELQWVDSSLVRGLDELPLGFYRQSALQTSLKEA